MNTYVFSNVSSSKQNSYIADITKKFNLELFSKYNDLTILENDNMIIDITKRWINIIILKEDADTINQIKKYFY